jgi:hypothetical protein
MQASDERRRTENRREQGAENEDVVLGLTGL